MTIRTGERYDSESRNLKICFYNRSKIFCRNPKEQNGVTSIRPFCAPSILRQY